MDCNIIVAIESNLTTTDKGRLLEDLSAKIMKAQQYEVINTIKVTGMELDLFARHNFSGEEIIVECKAWEDNLSGDVITKLLGNVVVNSASAGWLITTGGLGKDAEGLKKTWEDKPINERKKLIFYTSDRIIRLLIDNRIIVNPEQLVSQIPSNFYFINKSVLFITNIGIYWLFPGGSSSAGIATTVIAFDASQGNRIIDIDILKRLRAIKSVFSKHDWIVTDDNNRNKKAGNEFESITTIVCGDAWTDYRPSRPEDYVGRHDLIKSIITFFTDVQEKMTEMRLFSIKSPSGWGKSSTIIKLMQQLQSSRRKNHCFMYSVDVRTAMSSRYAELAFKSCLEAAIESKFVDIDKVKIAIGDINDITAAPDVQRILEQLREEKKIIILVFDQFEEIFYKQELFDLFENVRRISNAIDSVKENIIIGFAWKTDFSIPSDHPAYYLWSNLQEHRKEFDLMQFSDGEIKSAINVFSKELGQKINPVLSRYLTQQCQGYPWLLKKLCIHVYNTVNAGHKQEDAIKQTLNIGDLFESELQALSAEENACVSFIAKESPADYFQVVDTFGQDVLQNLINHRTVIKRSTKLTLYWDIFKDYVLSSKLPDIVVEYMPQVQFNTFMKVLVLLIENESSVDVNFIIEQTLLGKKTIDNILIDLTMIGLITREKEGVRIKSCSQDKISKDIREFFQKHSVYRSLQKQFADGFVFEDYQKVFNSIYTTEKLSVKTQKIYAQRLLVWFIDSKLLNEDAQRYTFNYKQENLLVGENLTLGQKRFVRRKYSRRKRHTRNALELYWPQVSPQRVKEFYALQKVDIQNSTTLVARGYKKVIEDLISLDAISISEEGKIDVILKQEQLFNKVKAMSNISFAITRLQQNPSLKITEIGTEIDETFSKNWSTATIRVTGGMIYRWAKEFAH